MSTPDPNPTVSVAVSRPIVIAPETPVTQSNTVKTPTSQPPPAPPYRAIAPLQRHHPQQNIYQQPLPVRRSNPVAGSPRQSHQDPSGLQYPFASSGRGIPTRPGRQNSSPLAADPVGSPGGYPPRPVYAYPHGQGQSGSNLDPMIPFMRAAHSQIQQSSHLGSGYMKGVPHFLQPRVSQSSSLNRFVNEKSLILCVVGSCKLFCSLCFKC